MWGIAGRHTKPKNSAKARFTVTSVGTSDVPDDGPYLGPSDGVRLVDLSLRPDEHTALGADVHAEVACRDQMTGDR